MDYTTVDDRDMQMITDIKSKSFCNLKGKMILNGVTDTRNEFSTPKLVGLDVT